MKKEKQNYMQVGETIECSNCHPEKGFVNCDKIFSEHGIKCKCICHKEIKKGESWRNK